MARRTKRDVESDAEESSFKPEPSVKRKRRKIANKKDSGQQRKSNALLYLMVDMPIDVLLEVFKHLEVIDLMHLSRTSKALRSILMSRSSISIWKQAAANDGLPPCPDDLNEPQLAELMFGRSCDWCARNVSGQEIIWVARVRACKRCIESTYEPAHRYFEHTREYPSDLAKLLPSVTIRNKLYLDGDLDQEWRNQYKAKSGNERSKWLEALTEERSEIYDHAKACQMWFQSRHETRVRLRKAVILERLKERGWGDELDKLPGSGPTDSLAEVQKACQSELTEQILAGLDNTLDKFMQEAKATRIVREKKEFFKRVLLRLQEIFKEYLVTLPANHIFPNTADIYFHPMVKSALSAVESNEALEEALTSIQPSLPQIVEDCLQLSKQHLTDLVVDEYVQNNKPFDLSALTLASTLFYCKDCQHDLTLDQAVNHVCRDSHYYYYRLPDDVESVRNAIQEVPVTQRIKSTISFSLLQLRPFASVLHSCGIDPNTTTVTSMDATDPIIECLTCSNTDRGRVVMKWLSIPKHFRYHASVVDVSLLDEPEAETARARLLEKYQKETARTKEHICVYCRSPGGSMKLMQHAKEEHGIESPVYGEDIIVSPGTRGIRCEFDLWPPRL